VLETARKHKLWIVEDAACAFGSWYRGRHAGTFGEMGCFSFHPRKSITTGEGGMITTENEKLGEFARCLRDHGASRSDPSGHEGKAAFLLAEYNHLGYNYRLTDIQASLGCAQMERAEWILAERSQRARLYDEMLAGVEWLHRPVVPDGYIHGYQAYVCLFLPEKPSLNNVERLHRQRNKLMMRLEAKGIATRQGTHAPVTLGYYAEKYKLRPEQFPNAYLADRLSLALPLYPQMTVAEQECVVESLYQLENHAQPSNLSGA
jgi:perosamine synthetase